MTGWIIFASVLLFFFIVAMTWIKITVRCDAGSPSPYNLNDQEAKNPVIVWISVWFLKFRVFPSKKKKVNYKKFSIEKFRKMRRKQERKLRQKKRQDEKKAQKNKPKEEISAAENEKPKKSVKENINFVISLFKNIVCVILKKFYKYIRCDIYRFYVRVASEDAAKTAVVYGAVSQSVSYVMTLLGNTSHTKMVGSASVIVEPDFTSEKSEARILIRFRLRVWHIFALAVSAVIGFLKSR